MFSVVIPTTRPESVDEAVASAEAQGDVEVIVEHDPDRTGCGATRNRAIARATRPYIALLDDDDLFLPGRLDRIAEHVREDRIVTTNALVRRRGRSDVAWYPHFVAPFPADHAQQRVEILRRNFVFIQGVFARTAWEQVGGFAEGRDELRVVEDYDLWLRLIYRGVTAVLVDGILSVYRVHGDNLSNASSARLRGESEVVRGAPVDTRAERRARRARLTDLAYRRARVAVSARARGVLHRSDR